MIVWIRFRKVNSDIHLVKILAMLSLPNICAAKKQVSAAAIKRVRFGSTGALKNAAMKAKTNAKTSKIRASMGVGWLETTG